MMVADRRDGPLEGSDAGADDYVFKPFSAREVVARVRTQLLVCRQREALRTAADAQRLLRSDGAALSLLEEKLRASEERFRGTVENMPLNLALYSRDQRVLYINPSLARICRSPLSEMLGKHPEEVWPEAIAGPLKLHIERAIATGQRQDYELAMTLPGSTRVVRQWTVVPMDGPDGEVQQLLAMSHDITAQRQLVDELRESDRRKSEFIAVLSHELRNPLAAIRSSLYVLEHAPEGGSSERARNVIDRQVGQLARMVDDLLDVTRITRNKIQLQRARLDLGELVQQTIEDNRATLERSGVQLEARIADGALGVNADGARIAQVVTNLLGNAVKFTPGGGTVTISVFAEPAASRAVVQVSDTGTGIDPALLGRLFEPFMQADRTLDRTSGGLGLGLALVKGLVDLHGGEVNASSEGLGKGATFVIRLPLADPIASGTPAAARAPAPAAERRILVIEDDIDVANGLQFALEIDGHAVQVAHNGPDGIDRARRFHPEVVLCDIGLPGMNGYEVARAFRSDPSLSGTLLVALSGYAQAEDIEKARGAGFDRHLAKPASMDNLKRILEDRR
jgi:PAS domain S-box-containing protein